MTWSQSSNSRVPVHRAHLSLKFPKILLWKFDPFKWLVFDDTDVGPPTSIGESDRDGVGLVVEFWSLFKLIECEFNWNELLSLINQTLIQAREFHRYFVNMTDDSCCWLKVADQSLIPFEDLMVQHCHFGHRHLLPDHQLHLANTNPDCLRHAVKRFAISEIKRDCAEFRNFEIN